MVANENFIHIKLEREEALIAKKDILASQITLLKILKKINSYRAYRARELELKIDLYRKMRELKMMIGSLEKAFPKIKVPKMLNKEEKVEKPVRRTEVRDLSIEGQLQEIQRKLDQLQGR